MTDSLVETVLSFVRQSESWAIPIAFLVAFGVLLDALIVRSLLVPALSIDVGRAMWWPSRLSRPAGPGVEGGGAGGNGAAGSDKASRDAARAPGSPNGSGADADPRRDYPPLPDWTRVT